MRNVFSILFLTALTIGAVFLFRISLKQTLIDVDIEELAIYSQTEKDKKNDLSQRTFPILENIATENTDTEETSTSQEVAPSFDEDIIPAVQREILTPPPLKKEISLVKNGTLTIPGVIAATNVERIGGGQQPLSLNTKLSSAAMAKLQHMFDNQYFEHVGPDGTQPSDWVDGAEYAYKLTGENLALGDFSGDIDLVTAWMNSPGHRENIMKPEFTEIGIAVGKGMFDNHETWLAVQVFGRPMPDCAPIDTELKTEINENQNLLEALNANLLSDQQAISNTKNKFSKAYKKQVDTYNTLVAEYNNLIGKTEALVERYNTIVNTYNTCMAEG
jgi:uncharacterized protein YkwD